MTINMSSIAASASGFAALSVGAKVGVGIAIAVGAAGVIGGASYAAIKLTETKYDCIQTDTSDLKCGVVKGGKYKSLDECRCIGGVTDTDGKCSCGFAPDAAKTYHSITECFADASAQCGWTYTCDPSSPSPSKCTKTQTTSGFPDEPSCRCVAPLGGEALPDDPATLGGPFCQCTGIVPSAATGENAPRALFSTVDECFLNDKYKCGWKWEVPTC